MKRILVPTDFSHCARQACDVALAIAEKAQAELFFIHFHEEQPEVIHLPKRKQYQVERDETQAVITEELQLLVDEAQHRSIMATSIPVFNLEKSLEKYVDSFGIDLVVMGSRGGNGIRKVFTSTHTVQFIRHTSTPVLVIRQNTNADFKKIIFAYNFEEDLIKPMNIILDWVKIFKSELGLLFINVPYNFKETSKILTNIKRFMHQFHDIPYKAHIYNAISEEIGIHQFLVEFQADLLAVVTRGKTGFHRLLSHSVVEDILLDESKPVLVIKIADV